MEPTAQAEDTKNRQPPPWLAFFAAARAAMAFLTRIPCGKATPSEAALAWASAWFPVVGCLLGLTASLLLASLERAGSLVAAVAAVAFLAFITGAFHEDGLADSADALGGAFDRPKLFAILKDSRIGSFGATALILVLLLRITALAQLGPLAAGGLVWGQTISRTTPVWLMALMPYVTPDDAGRSSALVGARLAHVLFASGFALVAVSLLVLGDFLPLRGVLATLIVCPALALLCGWRFHVRAGGLTGDFLGATQQLTDAAVLVTLAATC